MPPHIAALSVREVLLGSAAAPAATGVLSAPFALACTTADLGLYVSRQYAPPMWDAVGRKQRGT
jgi:hypothetical protein